MDKDFAKLEAAIAAGVPVDLRQLCQGFHPADDERASRFVERYALYRIRNRETVELEELRRALPWLFESEALLRSAVHASIESMISVGQDPYAAADQLARSHPLAANEVKRLLSTWVDDDHRPTPTPDLRSLPCRIGFENHDGLPRFELIEEVSRNRRVVRYLATDSMGSDPTAIMHVDVSRIGVAVSEQDGVAQDFEGSTCVSVLESGMCSSLERYVAYDTAGCIGLLDWVGRQRGGVQPSAAVRLVCDVADAVISMHGLGRCHGAIAPRNIVVTPSGRALLMPNWPASNSEPVADTLDPYSPMGVLPFMAPETATEDRLLPVSDVYQLGSLLGWLLSGTLPNGATSERAFAWFYDDVERHHVMPKGMPRRLQEILQHATARHPKARTRSAAQLAERLERWQACEPFDRQEPRPVLVSLWAQRHPMIATAAALSILVFGLVYGMAWRSSERTIDRIDAAHRSQLSAMQEQIRQLTSQVEQSKIQLAAAELRREDAVQERERIVSKAQAIADQWRDSLIRKQQGDPISSLVYLALMDTLKLPGDEPDEDLLLNTTRTVVVEADQRWDQGDRDIEAVLWQILAGQTLHATSADDRASIYIDRANSILDRILVARDPLQDRILLRGS